MTRSDPGPAHAKAAGSRATIATQDPRPWLQARARWAKGNPAGSIGGPRGGTNNPPRLRRQAAREAPRSRWPPNTSTKAKPSTTRPPKPTPGPTIRIKLEGAQGTGTDAIRRKFSPAENGIGEFKRFRSVPKKNPLPRLKTLVNVDMLAGARTQILVSSFADPERPANF